MGRFDTPPTVTGAMRKWSYSEYGDFGHRSFELVHTWTGQATWPKISTPTAVLRPVRWVLVGAWQADRPGRKHIMQLIGSWWDGDGFVRVNSRHVNDLEAFTLLDEKSA